MQVTKQVCDRIKFAFPERKFEKAKQQKKQRTLLKSYSRKSPYSKGFLGASSKPFVVVQSLSRAQYFGYLMQRAESLEKTLMPGKIEGRKRRG